MIRKAFLMQVFPEQVEEYEKRHNPIWQELIDVFAGHGMHHYSIHHDPETHFLFGYVEIEDEARWAAIAKTDVCRRWYRKNRLGLGSRGVPFRNSARNLKKTERVCEP